MLSGSRNCLRTKIRARSPLQSTSLLGLTEISPIRSRFNPAAIKVKEEHLTPLREPQTRRIDPYCSALGAPGNHGPTAKPRTFRKYKIRVDPRGPSEYQSLPGAGSGTAFKRTWHYLTTPSIAESSYGGNGHLELSSMRTQRFDTDGAQTMEQDTPFKPSALDYPSALRPARQILFRKYIIPFSRKQAFNPEEAYAIEQAYLPDDRANTELRLSGKGQTQTEIQIRRVYLPDDGANAELQPPGKGQTQTEIQIRRVTNRRLAKERHDPRNLDWGEVVRLLAHASVPTKEIPGEKLQLRIETIMHLSGGIGPNSWILALRDGCHISILPCLYPDADRRVVVLRGSKRAASLTRAYLLDLDCNPARFMDEGPRIDQEMPLGPLAELRDSPDQQLPLFSVEDLPRPTVWTIRSFADYITVLVRLNILPGVKRELYHNITHNQRIAQALESLFASPDAAPFISIRALNSALRFVGRHTELASTADRLFQRCRELGLLPQINTYNLILLASLRRGNLERFRSTLVEMERMHVAPDGMTWLTIVKAAGSPRILDIAVQQVRRRGLFTPRVRTSLVKQIVELEFAETIRFEGGFASFVALLDTTYGPTWPDTQLVNLMLRACNTSDLWKSVAMVLSFASDRKVPSDWRTLACLLSICRARRSLRDLVKLVGSDNSWDSAAVTPLIFSVAWKNRCFNVCKVLWSYAATRGIITYNMLRQVARSLKSHWTVEQPSSSDRWRFTAGKVIAGLETGTQGFDLGSGTPTHPLNLGVHPSEWSLDDSARNEQFLQARKIIREDLAAWKRFERMAYDDLMGLLHEAYEKDCSWMRARKQEWPSLSWMIENAIHVPMKRKETKILVAETAALDHHHDQSPGMEALVAAVGQGQK